MAYRAVEYKNAPGTYANTEVISENIRVKGGSSTNQLRVFVKSAAADTDYKIQESIDGEEWVDCGVAGAAFTTTFSIADLTGVAYPQASLIRVIATGAITVTGLFVLQDW